METDVTTDITTETPHDVEVDLDDAEFDPDADVDIDDELDEDDLGGDDDLVGVDDLVEADGIVDVDPTLGVTVDGVGAATVTEIPVPPGTAAALVEPDTADDDVLLTDEVEASLDVILAERLRSSDEDSDDEVEDEDDDELPSQLATIIPVRRPEEFLCQSCFLLKPPGQLADADHQLCRDCA